MWSKTILCRVKFLLHMRDRYIWRRVAVIGLLKTIRAWTKAIVCCGKGKDSVPGYLRFLRIDIASQARGIGHAGAIPATSAPRRPFHIDRRQKHAAEDKHANAQAEEQAEESDCDDHHHM